jgi:hypothetical protein
MIQKLKMLLLPATAVLVMAMPLAFSSVASADVSQSDINNGLCAGSNIDFTNTNKSCSTNGASDANSLVKTVINVLSLIVGAVAVVMLIVGGFRYVTSGGKQESVAGAKNTILYALIGLVIVAVAQIVVRFVLSNVTTSVGSS